MRFIVNWGDKTQKIEAENERAAAEKFAEYFADKFGGVYKNSYSRPGDWLVRDPGGEHLICVREFSMRSLIGAADYDAAGAPRAAARTLKDCHMADLRANARAAQTSYAIGERAAK